MNAEQYKRCKQAHLLLINGCGEDCLNCVRPSCVCDDPQIQADADRWAAQKEHERKFYRDNRQARLNSAKEYYHNVKRPQRKPRGRWIVNQQTFNQLPNEFTYDDAARVWQITKTAAIERINNFLKLNPHCLTKVKTGRRCGQIRMRKV